MSNTKWVKLLAMFRGDLTLPSICLLSFLESKKQIETNIAGWWMVVPPYVESSAFAPTSLLAIETLLFPRVVKPQKFQTIPGGWKHQDVERLHQRINRLGHYPLEMTDDGLRLVAHGPLSG